MNFRNYVLAAAVVTAGALFVGAPPAHAAGKLCRLHISANDLMHYSTKVMTAGPGCSEIKVTLTNTGKLPVSVMGHDWVLVKTSISRPSPTQASRRDSPTTIRSPVIRASSPRPSSPEVASRRA